MKMHPYYRLLINVNLILFGAFIGFGIGWNAPGTVRHESVSLPSLTQWTATAAKQHIPASNAAEIKKIFRESYQETAAMLASGDITDTADARQQVFQFIQKKIRALNRTTQEEWQLIAAMKPFADALGDKLADEVQAGRIRDGPEDVARAFGASAKGL
jgi:hypothetical protein